MTPEDRLDALLTAHQRAERGRRHDNAVPSMVQHHSNGSADQVGGAAGDAELAPLLATAQRMTSLGTPQSDPVARALEARMLARATERRQQGLMAPLAARADVSCRSAPRCSGPHWWRQ
jgi:hypothetical protein